MGLKKLFSSEFKNPETPKKIFAASSAIALFFLAFKAPLDPDLFWHLKTGELMWQYKIIPEIDWYSFTMNEFPWIDHEWLAEILMFTVKNTFGYAGLAIFFASIAAFIFGWLIPRISLNTETNKYPFYTGIILGILGAVSSSLVFGSRPQIFSLLGATLILYIIKKYQINNKSKIIYLLPLLFLFWVNAHASFIMGLGLLAMFLLLDKNLRLPAMRHPEAEWVKLYKPLSPEAWKNMAIISILSALITLINPYGAGIYVEIFRTFSDSFARNVIIEWLSPNFHNTEGMIFSFYLILLFIIFSITKKVDLFSFALMPFFLFLAIQSSRNIPFFILISLPLLIRSLEGFEEIFSSVVQKKIIAISLSALLIFFPPIINETDDIIKTMRSNTELAKFGNFPEKKALDFMEKYREKNPGNMLNDYAWGGYIIQNSKCKMKNEKLSCEPKVFIDGRMAHWIAPERHILKDYIDMIDLKNNSAELMEKYKIKIIFTRKDSLIGRVFASSAQWKKIYEDDLALIYEKNQ